MYMRNRRTGTEVWKQDNVHQHVIINDILYLLHSTDSRRVPFRILGIQLDSGAKVWESAELPPDYAP